ncbi:hypothetical protein ABL78_5108 [Leptomonas seymouri]|uniref:Uncharacterized protein n=1 Tax=Leptomonas seymouri TaxID=5684 RepID=A0A0N0P5C1_LEPSE|nr:hypothetical protein ABL78_5108 [Leptomonas seymouri]|eukprot:KPI85827.1 hypothetical protein ABL78_5108 [Leptomonas seymouri]
MPTRLAHITSHFFDLPSQDVQATAGSPHPVVDFTTPSSPYQGSPLRRHGGRSPAAAVATARWRGNGAGGAANANPYGRPSSPSSSAALTPLQSPAFPTGSSNSFWPAFSVPQSTSGGATAAAAAATSTTAGTPQHHHLQHQMAAGASAASLHSANRPTRYAEGREGSSWQSFPSSPLFQALSNVGFEVGGVAHAPSLTAFPHMTTAAATSSPVARASGCRMAGGPSSRLGSATANLNGPTSLTRGGAANSYPAYSALPSVSNTSVDAPSAYPVCNPTASQYTEADAEFLLHPIMHYAQDENALRFRAAAMWRHRVEELAIAVNALEHPCSGRKCRSFSTQEHHVTLHHDYVLHARCSKLLTSVGQLSSTGAAVAASTSRAGGSAREGGIRGLGGVGAGGEGPSGVDHSSRRHPDLRPAAQRPRVFSNRDSAAVLLPHGASPADSLTSASGAAASLYLLEMTGQLGGESGEQLNERAAAAATGGPGAEAGSPRTDGSHAVFASSSTLSSRNGRRRRSGSHLTQASSHLTVTPQAGNGDADTGASSSKGSASSQVQGGEHKAVVDEVEISLMFSHNVFANFRTFPLQLAHRSYELLPARYRAGLDAISAEVLAQQQQMQRNGGIITGLDGGGGGGGNTGGGAGAVNGSGSNNSNTGAGAGGRMCGSHSRLADNNASAAAGLSCGNNSVTGGYDDISYIGVSYLTANGGLFAGHGAASATASPFMTASGGAQANSVLPSPHPSTSPRMMPFGGAGVWSGVRAEQTVSPLLPPRTMEERGSSGFNAHAIDEEAQNSTANANASPSLGPVPGSPLAPSLSAAAVSGTLSTSPTAANNSSGPSTLHRVHHTIQSFVARGEREVALHYIIAIAPYRFPSLSDSDRVLALFNQIRSFFPSPRFSTVLMAMEAWRSLYRPSVGASAADYTHMTQELLSLIETYLCHGRTYAEYVSGLLMLRVVLSLAMANTSLGSRNVPVLLQHRALVQERLPTLLLAVWVALMDYYTIDDIAHPPRRVLRDLAANAMQDLFIVSLELQMIVPVQNVVANAVNVFFNGPRPPASAASAGRSEAASAVVTSRHEVPPTHINLKRQYGQRRRDESTPLAKSISSSNTSIGPTAAAPSSADEQSLMPVVLNAADHPHASDVQASSVAPRNATTAAPVRSPLPLPLLSHTASSVATTEATRATTTASESASPVAPTASLHSSYRELTKSVWRSLKRTARRLVSAPSSSTSTGRNPTEGAGSADAHQFDQRVEHHAAAGSGSPSSSTAAPASDVAAPARRPSSLHPSPPLLIEVPDDMLLDIKADQAPELLATPSMPGWGVGSLSVGATGLSSPHLFCSHVTFTPDLQGAAMAAPTTRDEMPHSPILPTAPSASATFHTLWQPAFPTFWALPAQRLGKGGFGGPNMPTDGNASFGWTDAFWGSLLLDGCTSRDALWTMPLTLGLRAAGLPLTLESTVAAACLTIGAFLCAWRVAGHADAGDGGDADEGTGASSITRPKASSSAYSALTPPPPLIAMTSTSAAFPTTPTAFSGGRRERCGLGHTAASSAQVSCGAPATASPGCRPSQELLLLPLLTEAQVRAAVTGTAVGDEGESNTQLASPTSANGASKIIWGEASAGRHSVNASMLSVTLAAMTNMKPTAVPFYDRSETTVETDPEWQSLEGAARNVYLPAVVDMEAAALVKVNGKDSTSGPLTETKDARMHNRLHLAPTSPLAVQTPETKEEAKRSTANTPLNFLDAPESVATAVSTRQLFRSRASPTVSTHALPPKQTSAAYFGAAPNVEGGQRHVDFREATAGRTKAPSGSRAGTPARSPPAAETTTTATTAAPPLSFFLPSWAAKRLMDRCLHPTWDTAAPLEARSQDNMMGGGESGNAARTALPVGEASATTGGNYASNAEAPLTVGAETEVLLTTFMPLLSQYYGESFSKMQVTAATQLLVNRVMKVMRILSQTAHHRTDDAVVRGGLHGAKAGPSSSSSASKPPPPPLSAAMGSRQANTNAGGVTTLPRGSIKDPGSLLPSSVFGLGHDSAILDGTELLNAVLFMCTVAERYPALYETIVSHKLYPLLYHAMRLMALEEESQLWLPSCYPSTAAWVSSSSTTVSPTGTAASILGHHVRAQWMMLTAARSMFQRIAMPALLLIAHNMPSVACAQQCAPLVDRLVQVGLRQPFCTASVTTASCICAVFPSMARVCQAEVARAMSVVLSTADDFGEERDRQERKGSAKGAEGDSKGGSKHQHAARASAPLQRSPPHQLLRPSIVTGEEEARRSSTTAAHTQLSAGGGRPSGQQTPAAATMKPDIRHVHATATSGSFVLPSSPPHLQRQRRTSAVASYNTQCRRAAEVRLLKHQIFRFICLFPSNWEGTTFFFLEFCLPYLRHPDAQLRLECVQACANWPLSECLHSVERTMLQLSGSPYALAASGSVAAAGDGDTAAATSATLASFSSLSATGGGGGGGASTAGFSPSVASASFACGSPSLSAHNVNGGVRRATVSAAVTRVPVRDARSESSDLGQANPASSLCSVPFASPSTAVATATPLLAGQFSAARVVGGVRIGEAMFAAAAMTRDGPGLPARDSSGLFRRNGNANTPSAALPAGDDMQALRAASLLNSMPAVTLHTVQHHGRTHINALREIVHHLVEIAVCDPEPLIRRCALESLTPETYQLLYPHEAALQQLFIVLWDSYLPNRVKAVQLLCALAPLNPPFIYPRLREVLVRYVADMTNSVHSLGQRDSDRRRFSGELTGSAAGALGIYCVPSGMVPEDSLYVLSHIVSRLKQSTPLYLPQLLSIVYSVLRCPSSGRGSVMQAMHLLILLRDESTQDQSNLFDPFVDLIADQLADGEGDTPRVLATVAALQTLLQSAEPSQCSPQSLPVMVECLHSLLYRKPSVGTEFSMAVLQLLGTISNIEPWQPEMPPQAPALLRRPQNHYAIEPLSSMAGIFGNNSTKRLLWPVRAELADNTHQALEQLQKADSFMPFTVMVWPDTVLRALMRTASGYVSGTMSLTQDGLGECLLAMMNILTNTLAVHHLDLYLPSVLTLVMDLLERKDARPLQGRAPPSPFFMTPKSYIRGTVNKEGPPRERAKGLPTSAQAGASGEGSARGRMHGTLSENLWLLFLRSLYDLVLTAGRSIAPMYPLLNVFLHRSWKQTTLRGMVQCCEVLDALCWSVPDLLRADCDTWITMLLSALMHHDALVLTHRRDHETPTPTPTQTNTNASGVADGGQSPATTAAAEAQQTRNAALRNSFSPANEAERHEAFGNAATATRTTRSGAPGYGSNTSLRVSTSVAAESTFPPIPVAPFTPSGGPSVPPAAAAAQSREGEAGEGSFEEQMKLAYRALTMCLTSLQPISSVHRRRLVCLCLSECLKSSHVPQVTRRRAAAVTKATHMRQQATPEVDGSTKAVPSHSFQEAADPRTSNASAAQHSAHAMFDLMADPHEELISYINTCVCGPLIEYMLHSQLDTISMKVMRNVLARLESLSVVHEEALRRVTLMTGFSAVGVSGGATQKPQHNASMYGTTSDSARSTLPMDSTLVGAAAADAQAVSEPVRVLREARLREARELLYAQRLRQADDPSLGTTGSAGDETPPQGAAAASNNVDGSTPPSPMPLGARTAKEVLWFSNAPLSRMWVQSNDHTTTVRRYFPFDTVQTSWETEGEMHLLGCLFAAAAWRHPASTFPFIPVLYTFVAQRFGPESLVMSYMRCVCSSYYDLCVPPLFMSDEEVAAANWVCENQQQSHGVGTYDNSNVGSGRDSVFTRLQLNAFSSTAAASALRVTQQDADTSGTGEAGYGGTNDIILRHSTPGGEALPSLMGGAPTTSAASEVFANAANTAAFSASSTEGSRSGSREAAAPLQASCHDAASTTAVGAFSSASSALAPVTAAPGSTNNSHISTAAMGGVGMAVTPIASHGLLNADRTDPAVGGRRSAEMHATASFSNRDGDGARSGRAEPHHSEHDRTTSQVSVHLHSALPCLSGHLSLSQQQQQYSAAQQRLGATDASISTATTGGAGSLMCIATAATTEAGFDWYHSLSTRSPPSTRYQSPAAMATSIPVSSGILGGATGARAGFLAPAGVASGSGSDSEPIAIVSSFYPGSFLSCSTGDAVGSGGGGSSGLRFPSSAGAHGGGGPGLRNASVRGENGSAGGAGSGGSEPALTRPAAGPQNESPLPFPVVYTSGLHAQPPRPPSTSDLMPSLMSATATTAHAPPTGLGQPPSAMPAMGSFDTTATLSHRRSHHARPNSLFSGMPPVAATGSVATVSSRNTAAGPAGGGCSPLRNPPPVPVQAGCEDLACVQCASAAAAAPPHYDSPLQSNNVRRRMSPPPLHFPLYHNQHRSIASATGTAHLTPGDEAYVPAAGAPYPPPRRHSPHAPTLRSSGSNPGTPAWGLPAVRRTASGASQDTQGYLKTPPIETRSSGTASPPPFFAGSTSIQQPTAVTAGAVATIFNHQALTPLGPPSATADNNEDAFTSSSSAAHSTHDTIATQHHNSFILYFESHRLLRARGWRSWWEQFSLFMVECSQDYCVKACEAFARHHHVAFAYTELLPLALLSTLPSCTVAELVAWLQALGSFYAYHTDPGNSVPQQVALGVAQLAHEIRLHRKAFFPPEIVSQVIDVWLPDGVVADLAHHSLNPPLRILYLEQALALSFSWNRAALLMSAMDDVASSLERKLFVQDKRFQSWLRSVTAEMTGSTPTAPTHDSPLYPPSTNRSAPSRRIHHTRHALCSPCTATLTPGKSFSSSIDALPPSALELLGFYRAAALKYVFIYKKLRLAEGDQLQKRSGQRRSRDTPGRFSIGGERSSTEAPTSGGPSSTAIDSPEKAIVGAMRCYMCLHDFEAVLRLWDGVKKQRLYGQRETAAATAKDRAAGVFADESSGGAVDDSGEDGDVTSPTAKTPRWSAETSRYVALAAQALSRWEYVSDTARYMRTKHMPWSSGAISPLLERIFSSQQFFLDTTLMESGRLRNTKSCPNLATDPWGNEDEAADAFVRVSTTDAFSSEEASCPSLFSDSDEGSLLEQQQQLVFLGAALVAAHDYEGAKQVLGAVRDGLRDTYAVFHTNNTRIKLEWSCIFRQLSDLEEGIHTLESAAAIREDGTSATTTAAGVPSELEATGITYSGPGSLVFDREVHGRVYPEVTIRRLRNIVCRPLSATTSPLQRFMMIATRSAIAPISWQLENIVTLCEMLEKGGQPMRAAQMLHRYSLQATASSVMSSAAAAEYKQQLHLETLRRVIHNLPHEAELREMYACVQTALRQDLWQSRRAAARWGQSTSSPVCSFSFGGGAGRSSASLTMDPLLSVISDAKRRQGALLDAQELGPSLTSYQVELLLLSVTCRRRLAHLLLQNTPPAQRAATGGVRNHRSDVSLALAVSTPGAYGSSQCVSVSSCATPALPHLVGPPLSSSSGGVPLSNPLGHSLVERGEEEEEHEELPMYLHSPVSSSMARQLIGFPKNSPSPPAALEAPPSSVPSSHMILGAASSATPLPDKATPPNSSINCNISSHGDAAVAAATLSPTTHSSVDREARAHTSGGFRQRQLPSWGAGERESMGAAFADNAEEDGGNAMMESLTGENALFVEYYLLEHAVTVTHYVPSVWREFGLLLFDICLAIHAEWKATADDETKQNFLAQSAKAIHGLQLAAQLWESGSASALSRGLGPFPAMAQRRHRHARSALPSAHLLLKALHLAITCERIVQSEAQASPAPFAGAATAPAAGSTSVAPAMLSLPSLVDTAHTSSTFTGAEYSIINEVDEDAFHNNIGLDTVSPSTASASPSSAFQSFLPCEDSVFAGDEGKASAGAGGLQARQQQQHRQHRDAHGAVQSKPKRETAVDGCGGDVGPSSVPRKAPTASAGKSTDGGFACLDFSAASYAQWAAISPLLVAAATHHPAVYTALRDMCVRSRHMLRQFIFTLISSFEHGHQTLFVQRADQVSRGRGLAGTRSAMVEEPPNAYAAAARSSCGSQPQWASSSTPCSMSSMSGSHSARGVSATSQEHHGGRRVTAVPDLWDDDAGDMELNQQGSGNGGSSAESSSATARTHSVGESLWDESRHGAQRTRVTGGTTAAADAADTQESTDTAIFGIECGSSIEASFSASDAEKQGRSSTAFEHDDGDGDDDADVLRMPAHFSGSRPCQRAQSPLPVQQQQHHQEQRRQQTKQDRYNTPAPLPETTLFFDSPSKDGPTVRSLLLADVAAAGLGHYQHVHEAMQLRGFVWRSWDAETMHTGAPVGAHDLKEAGATTAPEQPHHGTYTNISRINLGGGLDECAPPIELDTEVALDLQEADGTLKAMELVLGGHCPLPVPVWLLSSVFGMTTPVDDDSTPGDQAAAATSTKTNRYGNSSSSNADDAAHRLGNASASKPACNNVHTAGLAAGSRPLEGRAGAGAADCVTHGPQPKTQETSASSPPAAAASSRGPDEAPATVPFSPSTVPGVVHARRYLVPQPAPHHRKEEVISLMLSDGAMCRLRHVARGPLGVAAPQPHSRSAPHPAVPRECKVGEKTPFTTTASVATAVTTVDGEGVHYVVPHSLMEQIIDMLLSHFPLTNLQRPFALPLGLQDYLTLLPEQASGSVFGPTVAAAVMRTGDQKIWGSSVSFLTGVSSSVLSMAVSLLTPFLSPPFARRTPSLHHLMEGYAMHLRVREMAQAAQDAVELYPTSDFAATYIAAETGRGPGAQSDNSFPFNWAYGYPASAPPSETAMVATLSLPKYHDLVHQRKMSELRYDQLVAMAYNRGNLRHLVTYVRELLAARPPDSTAPASPTRCYAPTPETGNTSETSSTTATALTGGAARTDVDTHSKNTADGTFACQQRLYAYLATLPRTEAHLRKLLIELEEAMREEPVAATTTAMWHDNSNNSGTSQQQQQHHPHAIDAVLLSDGHCVNATAAASASMSVPPLTAAPAGVSSLGALTPQAWQACRLALFRVESSRCRSALADAFSADSSDPTHWLEVRRTYAKELAEWSVIQYLFDMYGRECGDVMVNTYDGHVSMHAIGWCSLQKAWCSSGGRRQKMCPAATPAPSASTVKGGDLLTSSPFPTRDPTLFRLTPVLQCGLPMQSPYALFQYRAASVLHDIYMYVRDLAGIATYGVDSVTAFAYTTSPAKLETGGGDGRLPVFSSPLHTTPTVTTRTSPSTHQTTPLSHRAKGQKTAPWWVATKSRVSLSAATAHASKSEGSPAPAPFSGSADDDRIINGVHSGLPLQPLTLVTPPLYPQMLTRRDVPPVSLPSSSSTTPTAPTSVAALLHSYPRGNVVTTAAAAAAAAHTGDSGNDVGGDGAAAPAARADAQRHTNTPSVAKSTAVSEASSYDALLEPAAPALVFPATPIPFVSASAAGGDGGTAAADTGMSTPMSTGVKGGRISMSEGPVPFSCASGYRGENRWDGVLHPLAASSERHHEDPAHAHQRPRHIHAPLPPPPRCFDASSLRLKLSYDILLVLHADVEQEGRETMLKLFKSQREATEESWPGPPFMPQSPVLAAKGSEPGDNKGGVGVDENDAATGAADERATSNHNHGCNDATEPFSSKSFSQTASNGSSATSSNSSKKEGGTEAPASAATAAPATQSAYDFVTRLVAAATDEVNLLGVDDVTPHLWCRWAPHW